jgi:hypothetical protein
VALRKVDAVADLFHADPGDEHRSEVGVLVDLEPTDTAAP